MRLSSPVFALPSFPKTCLLLALSVSATAWLGGCNKATPGANGVDGSAVAQAGAGASSRGKSLSKSSTASGAVDLVVQDICVVPAAMSLNGAITWLRANVVPTINSSWDAKQFSVTSGTKATRLWLPRIHVGISGAACWAVGGTAAVNKATVAELRLQAGEMQKRLRRSGNDIQRALAAIDAMSSAGVAFGACDSKCGRSLAAGTGAYDMGSTTVYHYVPGVPVSKESMSVSTRLAF